MSGSSIEFLGTLSFVFSRFFTREICTLQKSIALTPLLPKAGPTGGEGVAPPAPTMSLTTWSVAATFLDILFEMREAVLGSWETD